VLGVGSGKSADWLESLKQNFDVTEVSNVEQAQELLKQKSFDAVFSQTCDFLPLERVVVSEQAVAILNTICEGVCLVGPEGLVLWNNHKMEGFSESIKEGISKISYEAYLYFDAKIISGVAENQLRPRKRSYVDPESDRYFEMIITPMRKNQGELSQVATVVWDATASRKLQQRIDAIDKAGRELVRLDADALKGKTVEQRICLVEEKIIKYANDLLHFDHFVVRIINRKTNLLEVLIGVGIPQDAQDIEIFSNSQDNGITGYVVSTGRSYICNNPETDNRYLPGLPDAQSTLTVPLRIHDSVIGALNVESARKGAFSEEDRQVAEIFGRYIAIALNVLDLLVVERFETTGQAVDHFTREVSEPLSEIITASCQLMEDYIGHDDMRYRLQGIIDNVVNIRTAMKSAQNGPRGILESQSRRPMQADPELSGKQVLVVDDEPFIRQTISEVVQKYGMIADTACDGKKALSLIGQRTYDLVVSDIKLPFATGYEVFAAARKKNKHVPVILMTGFGYDPNHSIVRANREGLSAILYKPFKIDQLMTEIRQAICSGT
jgi:CheY-like chemotaxis protein/GAF domain-containing protein